MNLPQELSWMDAAFLASVSVFLLAWVQYWKTVLPDNALIVRGFSLASAIGFSYLLAVVMPKQMSILSVIVYGIASAIFSELAYQFLSGSKSKAFSLPSRAELKEPAEKK